MRPLELTVEGFRSYREEQTFLFEGRSLFGIVGPTGAGKSSILEAITYALYGKTRREERETSKFIRSGSEAARVRLVFEVDDEAWEVTRVIRRRGQAPVVLRRLGTSSAEAVGRATVNARVEELVGLDFEAFCSSIVLAQGEFDRFLMATPANRSRILKGIFRLERVDALREAARQQSFQLEARISGLRGELGSLPADPARLDTLREQMRAATERAVAIRDELADVIRADAALRGATVDLRRIEERIGETVRASERIPPLTIMERLGRLEQEKAAALVQTQERAALARAGLEKTQVQAALAEKESGGEKLLRRSRELARDRDRLGTGIKSVESELQTRAVALGAAQAEVGRGKAAAGVAESAVAEARADLEALYSHHAVHLLRGGLFAGGACPVCDQVVSRLPPAGAAPELDSARATLEGREAESSAVRERLHQACRDHDLEADRQHRLLSDLDEARRTLDEVTAELVGLLGEKADPTREVDRREAALRQTTAAVRAAQQEVAYAESGIHEAQVQVDALALERRRFAAVLIEMCGFLRVKGPSFDGPLAEFVEAASRAGEAATSIIAGEERRRSQIREQAAEAAKRVEAFRARFGLAAGAPPTRALEEANAAIGSLQGEISRVEHAIARARELEDTITAVASERGLYDRLVADLTDHRFTAYLLDWERRLLSRLGSEKLIELTGHYRFDDDGDFQIVDVRNDSRRSADTLSGGEAFLASLALALGLGEAVSQEGGRLGCFFLDEGFGSLDPESLDLALDGIERLATPGRLIGLISHLGGIQARLDDLIVLEKAADGSTIVVQAEGPLSYPAVLI